MRNSGNGLHCLLKFYTAIFEIVLFEDLKTDCGDNLLLIFIFNNPEIVAILRWQKYKMGLSFTKKAYWKWDYKNDINFKKQK